MMLSGDLGVFITYCISSYHYGIIPLPMFPVSQRMKTQQLLIGVLVSMTAWHVESAVVPCPFPCLCNVLAINCSSQHLTSFPMYFPSNIDHLDLSNNVISFLPNSLKDLQDITTLNLAENNIQEIVTSSIANMHKLKRLDLSMNRISNTLNINSLSNNNLLYYLNLSANPIRDLGNSWETVLHSDSISHLDLSNCALSSINNHFVFSALTNLTYLNLSGNPLKIIDKVASLTLSHLDLSSCNLYYLRDTTFTDLPNLQDLNLAKNSHLTMLTRYQNLMSTSLLYLDASYCALDQVDIQGFPSLIQASLKGNIIKILPDRILQNNKYLVSLDLSENSIHHLDTFAFMGAESLYVLDLSMNFLTDFHWGTFSQTPFLGHLNLSRNVLTSLKNITALSLSLLDVSKNDIISITPTSLINMPELRILNLSQNSIEILPLGLQSISLQNLDLSFCRISLLNEFTFMYLPSLKIIDLSGNRFTNPIKQDLLQHLPNLIELNLINNPWQCNCDDKDLKTLWYYLTEPKKRSKYLNRLTCQFPENLTGLSWEVSCFKKFDHENRKSSFREKPWVSLLIIFVSLSCIMSIMIVIRQAFQVRDIERRQAEMSEVRLHTNQDRRSRITDNLYEEHLEVALRRSQNEVQQRSPIAELTKLPSYEEALLLPKPSSSKDLQSLVDKYEQTGRFEHQYESIDHTRPSSSLLIETNRDENVSTSEQPSLRQTERIEHEYQSINEIDQLPYVENRGTTHHYETVNNRGRSVQRNPETIPDEDNEQLYNQDQIVIVEPTPCENTMQPRSHRFGPTRSRASSIDDSFTIIDPNNLQRTNENV